MFYFVRNPFLEISNMIKEQFLTINGTSLAVKESGKGKDIILFIHGSCMSSDNWLPQLQNEELNNQYKLVAIDLPGHGQSKWIGDEPSGYRMGRLAPLIKAVLDHFGPEKYILVGLSYGTNIIGEINPSLPGCQGIMLVSPCIVNNAHPPSEVITPGANGHVIVAANPTDKDLNDYVFQHLKNIEIGKRYIESYRNTDPTFRVEIGKATMEGDWSDELANIQNWNLPVCVIFGEEDSLLKTDYLNAFAPLWNNEVYKVANAGHMVNEEQPEAFNKILLSFAQEVFK